MHAFKRNLLALAFAAAFVSPVAFSQPAPATGGAGRATADPAQMSSHPTVPNLPSQANTGATDAVSQKTTARETKPVSSTAAKAATSTATASQSATSTQASPPPTRDQGEQHAAARSAVVSRDLWVQLDIDADSRISLAEAAPNVDLSASFAAMDSNDDGFVTQAEYSAYTKLKQ